MLQNIPIFIYGEDVTLTLELPSTPWIRSLRKAGGDIEADSGVRAGFIVREDELLTFSLRFHEAQWAEIQAFIDFAQTGIPFIWFPDQTDLTINFTVCLDAPASGSTYQSALDDGLPRIQLLTITVIEPGAPGIPWEGLPEFDPREPITPAVIGRPARLVIEPEINPLEEDDTLQLIPTFYDFLDNVIPDVDPTSWESDNPTAASVNSSGLVTANDGLPFVLQQQNDFAEAPWVNTGTAVEDEDGHLGVQFTRVFSGSTPKQGFVVAPEFAGEDCYITVFVRPDGVDEFVAGTYEGALVDVTTNTDKVRWRFTITTAGVIALTTVTGTNVRSAILTDFVRAYTFKATALSDSHAYEFRLRDAGSAASLLCAYAIITMSADAVAAVVAKYDAVIGHSHIHLTSNSSIQFVDDPVTTVYILPDTPGHYHVSGTFTIFGVGGGGGGSSNNGGGGGHVDGGTRTADGDITWSIGAGGAPGAPTGASGGSTTITLDGVTTLFTAAGGGGAGSEFGGGSQGGIGGGIVGMGCPNSASATGGGGGAGAQSAGNDASILSGCNGCFIAAGGGGDGLVILFEHRIIAMLGPGGGGGAIFAGSCGASVGPRGFVGGGIGGENSAGGQGIDGIGAGGGNGAAGTRGQLIIIYKPGEATITHVP